MKKTFYIYILFRPWNFQPCYVGKGSGDRWMTHNWSREKHPNPHLANIYKKAKGPLPCVILHEGLIEELAFEYERALVAAIGRVANGGPLANQTDGGEGLSGMIFSEEHKRGISQSKKGIRTVSDEGIEQIRLKLTGLKQSKETIVKRANSLRGKPQKPEVVQARAKNLTGKKRTGQALENIRAGRKVSPEVEASRVEKFKAKVTGRKPTPEARASQQAGIDAYWARRRAEKN